MLDSTLGGEYASVMDRSDYQPESASKGVINYIVERIEEEKGPSNDTDPNDPNDLSSQVSNIFDMLVDMLGSFEETAGAALSLIEPPDAFGEIAGIAFNNEGMTSEPVGDPQFLENATNDIDSQLQIDQPIETTLNDMEEGVFEYIYDNTDNGFDGGFDSQGVISDESFNDLSNLSLPASEDTYYPQTYDEFLQQLDSMPTDAEIAEFEATNPQIPVEYLEPPGEYDPSPSMLMDDNYFEQICQQYENSLADQNPNQNIDYSNPSDDLARDSLTNNTASTVSDTSSMVDAAELFL
jgi:hypothetical protein